MLTGERISMKSMKMKYREKIMVAAQSSLVGNGRAR